MVNLIYWPLIGACLYAGFYQYPIWSILVLGAAAMVGFFVLKPHALEIGTRERGLSYLLTMLIGSSIIPAALFGIGWLVGRAFA